MMLDCSVVCLQTFCAMMFDFVVVRLQNLHAMMLHFGVMCLQNLHAMALDLGVVSLQNFHGNFEAWRWLLMIGVLVPINHVGNLLVKMLVWLVEYVFWFQKKALYYLVGTKVCFPEFV